MHLNSAALHNVKPTCIEVLLCVMFLKAEPDIQRLQKGQGAMLGARACACIHVHAYLSSLVCTNVCVYVCTGLSQEGCVLVGLSETSGLAVSGGSESSVHVCTAVRRWRRPAADTGSQEPPSYLKTLDCA